jgi:NAD(P)-dependent dehydrogenase (short-subunit alcohol dehydrogenase family)
MLKGSKMGSDGFRIISTSSIAHKRCGDWQAEGILEDLNWTRREWDKDRNYAETKFENILFSRALNNFHRQEQGEGDGGLRDLRSVSLHPGVVDTPFFENMSFVNSWYTPLIRPIWWYFTKTESDGAQTSLDLAVRPWGRLEKGAYHKDCAVAQARTDAGDEVLIKGLWNKTIDLFAERNVELKSFKKLD